MKTLLLFILFPLASMAQEKIIHQDPTGIKPGNIFIKWTPTAMMGFFPAIQFAGEYVYSRRSSVQLEYGYIQEFIESGLANHSIRGHRLRLEQRNYFGKRKIFFISPEISVQVCKWRQAGHFYTFVVDSNNHLNLTEGRTENIHIRKLFATANLKFGVQFRVAGRFYGSLYVGPGFRFTNTEWLSQHTGDYFNIDPGFTRYSPDFYRGNRRSYNLIGGIQIGCRIW